MTNTKTYTGIREPKVTFLTGTELPLETIYAVWQQSKNEDELVTPHQVKATVPEKDVVDLFQRVIAQQIPVSQHLRFIFILENVSVSWREQAVRHKVFGIVGPDRMGVDIVPDLDDSAWWSQSMRIMSMSEFAQQGRFRIADTIREVDGATERYREVMQQIENGYNDLVAMGVPMEDARDLIPLGAQHRISWDLSLRAMQHIIGTRSCWILQIGLWLPVIDGMVSELVSKVHPAFMELVNPPCIADGKFSGCTFCHENERRLDERDSLPLCPLYWNYHVGRDKQVPMMDAIEKRAAIYRGFWHRDPYTGNPIVKDEG